MGAADLFNAKTGYAYPSNGWLAENTLIAEKKVQERRWPCSKKPARSSVVG